MNTRERKIKANEKQILRKYIMNEMGRSAKEKTLGKKCKNKIEGNRVGR